MLNFLQSKEEYEVSVCLCGSHGCRGSYLNLAVAGDFQKVISEFRKCFAHPFVNSTMPMDIHKRLYLVDLSFCVFLLELASDII